MTQLPPTPQGNVLCHLCYFKCKCLGYGRENNIFSRSGVEINFSDVNIVTEVEHFLPREQICSLGSFHFFDSCDKNLMGVFIFFLLL
jgi:hypothetical protein